MRKIPIIVKKYPKRTKLALDEWKLFDSDKYVLIKYVKYPIKINTIAIIKKNSSIIGFRLFTIKRIKILKKFSISANKSKKNCSCIKNFT